jgi:hypothetical protein
MSTTLELGELRLAIAKTELRLTSHATAELAHSLRSEERSEDSPSETIDWELVRRSWIQRGAGLRFELLICVDKQPPSGAELEALGGLICRADVQVITLMIDCLLMSK